MVHGPWYNGRYIIKQNLTLISKKILLSYLLKAITWFSFILKVINEWILEDKIAVKIVIPTTSKLLLFSSEQVENENPSRVHKNNRFSVLIFFKCVGNGKSEIALQRFNCKAILNFIRNKEINWKKNHLIKL